MTDISPPHLRGRGRGEGTSYMDHKEMEMAAGKASLVAYKVEYAGPATYMKAFEDTGFGFVLDDDGETGYLYATTEDFQEVLDGLHLFNDDQPDRLTNKDRVYIIFNPEMLKAGLYYRNRYQAIVDFKGAKACCRSGFPPPEPSGWCTSAHTWDPKMEGGLTFEKVEDGLPN